MKSPEGGLRNPFRALGNSNFRLWFGGASVSNIGTWLQRTALEWLVFTELTRHDAAAVGFVATLQFGPQLLLLPWVGAAADFYARKNLLLITQGALGLLALTLGALTVTGLVGLWHVYLFALLFGCVSALDTPVRQAFVVDLVGPDYLANAVALNSTSYNASRFVGPAIAGICIATIGAGWAIVMNGFSYIAVLISLLCLRTENLHVGVRAAAASRKISDGLRYIADHRDLSAMLFMLGVIGIFCLNSAIFISSMAVRIFHADATDYGLLCSIFAIGSVAGALIATGRHTPSFSILPRSALLLAIGCFCAAVAPTFGTFAAALVVIGIATLTLLNVSNSLMLLSTNAVVHGRVMAIRLGVILGGTALGAPLMGWVTNAFDPRTALCVAATAGFAAALFGFRHDRQRKATDLENSDGDYRSVEK